MAFKICASRNCNNTQRNRPELKFFSFPQSEQFARAWLQACNNPDLTHKSMDQLHRLYLCAEHFEDKCFMDPKDKTSLIRWKDVYSIPTLFKHNSPAQKGFVGPNPSLSILLKQCMNGRLQKICRFCSCLKPTSSLVPIYGSFYEPLMGKLKPFGICLKKNDGMPSQICRSCAAKLVICVETLEQFSDTENKLKMMGSTDISTLSCDQDEILKQLIENNHSSKSKENSNCFNVSTYSQQTRQDQTTSKNKSGQIEEVELSDASDKIDVKEEVIDETDNADDSSNIDIHFVTVKQEAEDEAVLLTNNLNHEASSSQQPLEFIEVKKDKSPQLFEEEEEVEEIEDVLKIDEKESTSTELKNVDPLRNKNQVICKECYQTFKTQQLLMKHILSEHTFGKSSETFYWPKMRIYRCKICKAMINSSIGYLSHLKMHAAATPEIELSVLKSEAFTTLQQKSDINIIKDAETVQFSKRRKGNDLKNSNREEFKCDICDLSFSQQIELNSHIIVHKKGLTCETCDITFQTLEDFQEHKKEHIPLEQQRYINKPFRVEIKNSIRPKESNSFEKNEMPNRTDLEADPQSEMIFVDEPIKKEEEEIPVIQLDDDSISSSENTEEKNDLNEDKRYKCLICFLHFKEEDAYKSHFRTHESRNLNFIKFICHVCGYRFNHQKHFNQHVKSHAHKLSKEIEIKEKLNNKNHKCNFCEASFNTNSILITHLKSAHTVACKECNQEFHSQENLKTHTREAHRDSKYICNLCGKHFISQENIYEHIVVHGNEKKSEDIHEKLEKPLRCKICRLVFKTTYTMSCHMNKHNGVKKPYSCDKCEMKFDRCSKFEEHYEKHKPKVDYDRPYVCTICDSRFVLETALKRHYLREHFTNVTTGKRKLREW